MTVAIKHVRHRVARKHRHAGLTITVCGQRFYRGGTRRDWSVHEPATADCPRCYGARR